MRTKNAEAEAHEWLMAMGRDGRIDTIVQSR